MKHSFIKKLVFIAILIVAILSPSPMMPQGRNGNDRRPAQERRNDNRPTNRNPGNRHDRRPEKHPAPQRRPGNGRPADPPRHPGHKQPAPHRPAAVRPAPRPHNWHRPSPPPPNHFRVPHRIPPRPMAPPPGYRPYVAAPAIRSILGITFGTVYNSVLDYLLLNGYTIDGYANNTVYLSDVMLLNQGWPLATLYCDSAGHLASAQFSYYSVHNNLNRYNTIYQLLCGTYGMPVYTTTSGITRQVTWYGGNNSGYITLQFDRTNGNYYTTLSVCI